MELLGETMETSKSDKAENMSFASWLKMNHPKQAKQDIFSLKVLSMLLLKSKAVHSRILQIKDIGEIESLIEKFRINKGINIYIGRRIVKLSATPLRNRPHMVFCSQGTS